MLENEQDNSISSEIDCSIQFNSKIEVKNWLSKYNLEVHKKYRVHESNHNLFEAKCFDPDCEFHFKVRKRRDGNFYFKDFKKHTCTSFETKIDERFTSHKLKSLNHDIENLRPKDAINYMLTNNGASLTYMQAYRGLKRCNNENLAAEKESYGLIEPWLNWQIENNHGSNMDYKDKLDQNDGIVKFECCFFAPIYSATALNHSLPVITLDACHTKGNYKGVIMIASLITGEDHAFIAAVGIAPTENLEYWRFFISAISRSLQLNSINNLVIISDREKGLLQAVTEILPGANHSYCVYHMEKNIKTMFKTNTAGLIWKAAKTLSKVEFERTLIQLRNEKGVAIEQYVRAIPPENWASSYFPVPRFGHTTSNVAESINSSIKSLRALPPYDILTGILRMINQSILKTRARISSLPDMEPSKAIKQILNKLKDVGRTLRVIASTTSNLAEVQDSRNSNNYRVFNGNDLTCSCMKQKEFGFPCEHVYAMVFTHNVPEAHFLSNIRLLSTVKRLYAGCMVPVDVQNLVSSDVRAPIQVPRRGRRKRTAARIPSLAERIRTRVVKCSICGDNTHNKRTCSRRSH